MVRLGPAAGRSDATTQRMIGHEQGAGPEPPTASDERVAASGEPRSGGAAAETERPRLRPLAFVVAAAGLVLAFLAVAPDQDLGWNLPVAILGYLLATVAILDGLGTFDGDPAARDGGAVPAPDPSSSITPAPDPGPEPATEPEPHTASAPTSAPEPTLDATLDPDLAWLPVPFPWLRLIELASAGVGCVAALRLAVMGALPWPRLSAALLVTSTFLDRKSVV